VACAGATLEQANTIVSRGLGPIVVSAVNSGCDPNRALTHAVQNLAMENASKISDVSFTKVLQMEEEGSLTPTQAKQILAEAVETGEDPTLLAKNRGFEAMESGALEILVDKAISENLGAWAKFCSGEEKVQGVFVGAVMKETKGQADGGEINRILQERRLSS